jgi:hypothetical protein
MKYVFTLKIPAIKHVLRIFVVHFELFSATLQVPKSPRTPTVTRPMCHAINHRFTKTFKMIATCDFCDKQMFIGTG